MDRGQLVNQSLSYLVKNTSMLVVALIGLGIPALIGLVVTNIDLLSAIMVTLVALTASAFMTGALISMVNAIAEGQNVSVESGIQAGLSKIMPLILVRVLLMAPVWIILLLVTGSLLGVFGTPLGQPGGIQPSNLAVLAGSITSIVVVVVLLSVILGAVSIGAERAIVLETTSILTAIRRGWQVFVANFRDFLIIGVMLLIVALGIGVLFSCAILPVLTSMSLIQPGLGESLQPGTVPTSFRTASLILTLVSLAVNVLLEVWFSGVWTLAFRHWQGKA